MLEALLSRWKDILLRTFDIRIGESRRVWLMLTNIFLIIQSLWIIKPVVNAQFISRVGIDQLPLVFLLVAVTSLGLATAYSRWLHRLPLGKIMVRTYIISVVCLMTFGLLLHFNLFPDWMTYLFYIGVALFGLITTSQFWLLANLVFTSLEAKRLFGFIGAGAIAGGISGGYLTTVITQFLDSNYLLFFAAILLLISLFINQNIWHSFVAAEHHTPQVQKSKKLHEFPLRLIRNSKHLSYLALIIGISVVVAKLIEFQFSAIASNNITDPDKLTAFFGFWFSTANAVSLGIQLLITQRMVGFLGVGRSLFVLPGALIVSSAAVLNSPMLWAGTTLKVLDISLKQSINKAATELLILPVPLAVKSQAKTFIDVFVDTTATGIGGLMLIFLINGMNLSIRAVSILALVLIGFWIYFATRARNEYVRSFKKQLGIIDEAEDKETSFRSDASVAESIRRTLKTGTVDQIIRLLEGIEESKDIKMMKDVIGLLSHESPRVRAAALNILYYHSDHSVTNAIEPLLKDPHVEVRSRAFSSLLAHTRVNRVEFINKSLSDNDPAINGAALVGLATEAQDNPRMQEQFNIDQRIRDKIEEANQIADTEEAAELRITVVRAIGYGKIKAFYDYLQDLMYDPHPAVSRKAIMAAGNTGDRRFIKTLIWFLTDESVHASAQKALAKFKPADLLEVLTEMTTNPETPVQLLVHLPVLTESMDTQQAVDFLFGLLEQHQHPALKFEALVVLHTLKTKFPHLSISGKRIIPFLIEETEDYKMLLAQHLTARKQLRGFNEDETVTIARTELTTLLEQRIDHTLKRIFWLLGLSYPPGTILPLYKDIRHDNPDIRISTVELLDNILEPGLKKVVIPIVESATEDELTEDDIERLEVALPTEIESYRAIMQGDDVRLKEAVQKLIDTIQDPEMEKLFQAESKD